MSHFRRRAAEFEAVQYTPTSENPLAFSEEPEWLLTALEVGRVTLHPKGVGDSSEPHLTLQAHAGAVIVAPTDWIIHDSEKRLRARDAIAFTKDYEPFPEPATGAEEPTKTGPEAAS